MEGVHPKRVDGDNSGSSSGDKDWVKIPDRKDLIQMDQDQKDRISTPDMEISDFSEASGGVGGNMEEERGKGDGAAMTQADDEMQVITSELPLLTRQPTLNSNVCKMRAHPGQKGSIVKRRPRSRFDILNDDPFAWNAGNMDGTETPQNDDNCDMNRAVPEPLFPSSAGLVAGGVGQSTGSWQKMAVDVDDKNNLSAMKIGVKLPGANQILQGFRGLKKTDSLRQKPGTDAARTEEPLVRVASFKNHGIKTKTATDVTSSGSEEKQIIVPTFKNRGVAPKVDSTVQREEEANKVAPWMQERQTRVAAKAAASNQTVLIGETAKKQTKTEVPCTFEAKPHLPFYTPTADNTITNQLSSTKEKQLEAHKKTDEIASTWSTSKRPAGLSEHKGQRPHLFGAAELDDMDPFGKLNQSGSSATLVPSLQSNGSDLLLLLEMPIGNEFGNNPSVVESTSSLGIALPVSGVVKIDDRKGVMSQVMRSSDNSDILQPLQPVQSVQPVQLLQPLQPSLPKEPVQLLQPLQPLQPKEPVELLQPLQPLQPVLLAKESQQEKPIEEKGWFLQKESLDMHSSDPVPPFSKDLFKNESAADEIRAKIPSKNDRVEGICNNASDPWSSSHNAVVIESQSFEELDIFSSNHNTEQYSAPKFPDRFENSLLLESPSDDCTTVVDNSKMFSPSTDVKKMNIREDAFSVFAHAKEMPVIVSVNERPSTQTKKSSSPNTDSLIGGFEPEVNVPHQSPASFHDSFINESKKDVGFESNMAKQDSPILPLFPKTEKYESSFSFDNHCDAVPRSDLVFEKITNDDKEEKSEMQPGKIAWGFSHESQTTASRQLDAGWLGDRSSNLEMQTSDSLKVRVTKSPECLSRTVAESLHAERCEGDTISTHILKNDAAKTSNGEKLTGSPDRYRPSHEFTKSSEKSSAHSAKLPEENKGCEIVKAPEKSSPHFARSPEENKSCHLAKSPEKSSLHLTKSTIEHLSSDRAMSPEHSSAQFGRSHEHSGVQQAASPFNSNVGLQVIKSSSQTEPDEFGTIISKPSEKLNEQYQENVAPAVINILPQLPRRSIDADWNGFINYCGPPKASSCNDEGRMPLETEPAEPANILEVETVIVNKVDLQHETTTVNMNGSRVESLSAQKVESKTLSRTATESPTNVLQKPSESPAEVVRGPSESPVKVVIKPSESAAKVVVVQKSSESPAKVVQRPSESPVKVVQRPSESAVKVVQRPSESPAKVVQNPSESLAKTVQKAPELNSKVQAEIKPSNLKPISTLHPEATILTSNGLKPNNKHPDMITKTADVQADEKSEQKSTLYDIKLRKTGTLEKILSPEKIPPPVVSTSSFVRPVLKPVDSSPRYDSMTAPAVENFLDTTQRKHSSSSSSPHTIISNRSPLKVTNQKFLPPPDASDEKPNWLKQLATRRKSRSDLGPVSPVISQPPTESHDGYFSKPKLRTSIGTAPSAMHVSYEVVQTAPWLQEWENKKRRNQVYESTDFTAVDSNNRRNEKPEFVRLAERIGS